MKSNFVEKRQLTGVLVLALVALASLNVSAKTASIIDRLSLAGSHQGANDFSYITIAEPGQRVNVTQAVVKGKYTIIDFQSKYCPDCLKMKPLLMNLAGVRPDIAVRLVDINRPGFKGIDWKSPVAAQYRIHEIPEFKLFSPNGVLIGQGDAAMNEVLACLHRDLPGAGKQR
jgi:thiol-disulfide isomerase/thioredoxin